MPTTNYTKNLWFFLFLYFGFLGGSTFVYSQDKSAQLGMATQLKNVTSFPIVAIKNIADWENHNNPKSYNHPEFGTLAFNAPCSNCVEVLEKRTIDGRYFIDLDDQSKFYVQKALGDLHQKIQGEWVTIKDQLHSSGNMRYVSDYLLDQPGIDFLKANTQLSTSSGKLNFNNWKLLVNQNGQVSNSYIANWTNYTVGSDGALIHDVFPGMDAEIIISRGAIKTSFIIKSNEFGAFDYLIFRDELDGDTPIHAQFVNGSHVRGIGNLKLVSGTEVLAIMDEAKLFAKNGPKDIARSAEYSIQSNQIDLLIDYEWINENIGSYQLVVDPLVTGSATLAQASITGSRYNATCNFTNSCDYNLVVATPANATITDVNYTFTYSADGIDCWLEDGAVRIGLGSCNSPNAGGFYWFCNNIGGGTCSATNQTVYSHISSCIPAPTCAPQNLTFTLKFFRSCWGATGCSNTCIGAASPWIMNVVGRTLEYTNPTTPITLSATTVCQGGSITASTQGLGGIPGYTYNWSFSPTGTPSLSTSASASISFPTSGAITLYSRVTDACGNQVTSSRVVTVTPGIVPTISANGPLTFCSGGSVTLTSSAPTGNTWSNGATTQSITVTTSGSYTVTSGTGGCSATSVATVVTVVPIATAPTITANGPTTFCEGGSVTLTSSAAAGNMWSTGETTQTITVTTNGTYSLTISSSGCVSPQASISVVVNPLPPVPTITANGPTTFCEGDNVTLTSSSATGNTWSNGDITSSILVATSGTYTVVVSNGACFATSAPVIVTVNPLPPIPMITASGPLTFCAGGSVTLTSSSTTGNTWSTGATTQSISVTASGSYSVVVSNGTCSSSSIATSVTVNPLPTVPTITASGPLTFCEGGSVTLTSSSATGNTWSTGETTQSITVSASNSYVLTVSNGACTSQSVATMVTVNPLPTVPIISASGPTTFCMGNSVTLTSSSQSGNTWSTGSNLQSLEVTSSGTYSVTVSNLGCSSTSLPMEVVVNALPVITASNNGPLCVNQTLELYANGPVGSTYSWSGPNAFNSTLQNPTIAAITVADFGIYSVTVTSNSCSTTESTTVIVSTVNSTEIIPAGPFCTTDGVATLSAVNPGGIWVGTGIVNGTAGLFDPAISGPGSFDVTYDIAGSCAGSSKINIVVHAAQIPDFTADSLSGCAPLSVVFTNLNPLTTVTSWDFGNGSSANQGSATYHTAGCHTVSLTVTDLNGCSATATKEEMICIHPTANASFTPTPYDVTITQPEIHFNNTSTNATGYQWIFGDGTYSSVTSPTHQYDEVSRNYQVELVATNAFGCSDTARVVVRVLEELIYYIPNTFTPNGDEHNHIFQPIFTSGFDPQHFSLLIFNKWGEIIFESQDAKTGWDGSYAGVLVQEGIYIWTVTFKDPNSDKKYTANGHVTLLK